MLIRFFFALILALAMASPALAFGGGGGSSERSSANTDYRNALKAIEAEDYARASGLLEKVVAKEPRNADAWNNLGYSERKQDRFEAALAAYQKALAIKPRHRGANEYLGELYLQMGNLPLAREQLKRLKSLCPRGCEEADELAEAVRAYEKAHPGS
ncbi:MAG: tetratricopeptide repeat protein [Rhodospirillales bacterium]|nr:MAG: tetratricopeptide repeat protein [Rhodospirillales bacterium]